MAVKAPITVDAGWFTNEDKQFVFSITQPDGVAAQDVTGWNLSWLLKAHKNDADTAAKITKTTLSGIALTTPLSGVVTVTISDTDTLALAPGNYYHELKRTDDGSETVLSYGSAALLRSLHRL